MAAKELDLSIVIIAFNEEKNLKRCLAGVPAGSEIIVLDSGSTDKTCEIAKSLGAKVFTRKFTNFSEQKNAAVEFATRRWIFSMDADELLDENLKSHLIEICSKETEDKLKRPSYRVKRKLVFMGRVMNYGKTSDQPIRLFQKGTGRFEGAIHEQLNFKKNQIGTLKKGALYHFSYESLTDYFEKFNVYTSKIAEKKLNAPNNFSSLGFCHVIRPWTEFAARYFFRLGFLDGYPGYCYAFISSFYCFVKYAKLKELKETNTK
jgi:glycosyltransferase involved in cell wall biosynthesis